MAHVPYRSASQPITDLIAGQVDVAMSHCSAHPNPQTCAAGPSVTSRRGRREVSSPGRRLTSPAGPECWWVLVRPDLGKVRPLNARSSTLVGSAGAGNL